MNNYSVPLPRSRKYFHKALLCYVHRYQHIVIIYITTHLPFEFPFTFKPPHKHLNQFLLLRGIGKIVLLVFSFSLKYVEITYQICHNLSIIVKYFEQLATYFNYPYCSQLENTESEILFLLLLFCSST